MSEARTVLTQGSSSFAAAARLLDPATRDSVARLYGWCRHCDDVVDGQTLGAPAAADAAHDPASALAALERDTRAALEGAQPCTGVFADLRLVARRHGLDPAWPLAHLDGFRLDVEERRYRTLDDLLEYCFGVAGVVGVMMARVMGAEGQDTLRRACDLGLAFQMTNIARDVVDDARVGRVYLPLDWLAEAGVAPENIATTADRQALAHVTRRLVMAAEPYYASAWCGVARLPTRSALAIGAAHRTYRAIGWKVVGRGARAWDTRTRTTPREKVALVAAGAARAIAARSLDGRRSRPGHLWTSPLL
jgi:phytoene synthase